MSKSGRQWIAAPLLVCLLLDFGGNSVAAVGSQPAAYVPRSASLSRVEAPGVAAALAHARDLALGLAAGAFTATDPPRGPSPAVVDGSVANVSTPTGQVSVTQKPGGPAPVSKATIPASQPSATIALASAPADVAPPKGTSGRVLTGFDTERSVEDPTGRDAYTTTFLNPDGTVTVRLSSVPVHYKDSNNTWQNIDNRIVRNAAGALTNASNDWRVTFGPMVAGEGVSITTADGPVRFVADGATGVLPTVEPDGTSVRYTDVYPATDLVYTVRGGAVEELLIVKSAAGRPSATFTVDGAQFDKAGADFVGRGTDRLARRVHLSAPETFDGRGRPVDLANQVFQASDAGAGRSKVTVGVTKAYLASLSADMFPLTVDPSVGVSVGNSFVQSYANYTNTGGSYASYNDGYVRVGNPYLSSTSKVRWRSVASIDYGAYLWANVVDAYVTTTVVDGTGAGAQGFNVYWADQFGFHYSVAPRVSTQYSPPSIAYSNTWAPYLSSTVSSGTANHTGSGLYSLFNNFTRTGTAGGALLFTGNEGTAYTFKKMAITVNLTINRWPSTPSLWSGGASGHTLTWGAAANGTDPDSDPIYYNHYVYSGSDLIYQTGWIGSRTATWTAPSQYRGGTLTFGTQQWDGVCVAGECHVTGSGNGTWSNVGNLAPQAGALTSPAAGALIHPSPVTAPTVTFSGTVGADTAPEADPLWYAFFYCPNSNCTTGGSPGPVFLQGWTQSTAGAAVSLANVAFSTNQYGQPLYWGIATHDGVATTYSALRTFTLTNSAPPEATGVVNPANGSFTPDLTPTLTVNSVTDPNSDPVNYTFRICNQTTWVADTSKCIESTPISATGGQAAWTIPATNPLKWGQPNYWWLKTSDGVLTTESGTKAWFIPRKTPANTPAIGFGTQPNMRGVADVNPGNGNLTYTAHDLSVQALGGPLEEVRTYNSASTTVAGFGPGWASTWGYTLTNQTAGISITRPDGSVLFYGRNGDGSLAPAFADGSTVAANPSAPAGIISPAWGVTDHDRTVFYFSTAGLFLGAKDINGRVTTMTTGGNTQTVTDVASGRQLFIDWSNTPGASGSRIVATRTVPIAAHASTAIQWRYYYDASSRLIQACDPRNNAQTTGYCTVYSYDSSNRVTSVVLPKGNTQMAVTYQADGKVATRKDGFNKTWTFAYSTNVSFTNLQGQSVVAARRTTVTDPLNHNDVYDYDVGIRVMHYDNLSGLAISSPTTPTALSMSKPRTTHCRRCGLTRSPSTTTTTPTATWSRRSTPRATSGLRRSTRRRTA